MDRIWQWAWDRYGSRYSWAYFAISFLVVLPMYLASILVIVAYEESGQYFGAAAVTVFAVSVLVYANVLPGLGHIRSVDEWAVGREVDRATALEDTYTYAREAVVRAVGVYSVGAAALFVVVGAIAGATGSRLVQYGIMGAAFGTAVGTGTHGGSGVAAGAGRHGR